jgi:hypothetical protein
MPPAVESLLLLNASASIVTLAGPTEEVTALLAGSLERGKAAGESSPAYALALANHGLVTWAQGKPEGEGEVRRALEIQEATQPRPIEACVVRLAMGEQQMSGGRLAEARPLILEGESCLARALVPDSIVLLSARLSVLEWLVRSGRGSEAAGPLGAAAREIEQRLPKARWLIAEALVWQGRVMCKSGQAEEGASALRKAGGLLTAEFGEGSAGVRSVEKAIAACGK